MSQPTQISNTSNPPADLKKLSEIALWIRREIIKMLGIAGSGHPGGSLSAKAQSAGREHRIEYIEPIRHHLITWIEVSKREVRFAFVHEAQVKSWEPA